MKSNMPSVRISIATALIALIVAFTPSAVASVSHPVPDDAPKPCCTYPY